MKRDAELHADEDRKKREYAEARNEADNKLFQIEKLLKESGDKITEADKAPIQRAVEKLKDAMKGTDLNALKSALSELDTASQAMAQHLYQKGDAAGGPTGATPGSQAKGNEDIPDAEYEVKK